MVDQPCLDVAHPCCLILPSERLRDDRRILPASGDSGGVVVFYGELAILASDCLFGIGCCGIHGGDDGQLLN